MNQNNETHSTPDHSVGKMPRRLVLVRHGESEANIVQKALKNGTISEYPKGISEIPDREIRLSTLGRLQAEATVAGVLLFLLTLSDNLP